MKTSKRAVFSMYFFIFVVIPILLTFTLPEDKSLKYVVILGFLGGALAQVTYMWLNRPRRSYVYRPEYQQLLVLFTAEPFEIERDGLRLRLVMMRGLDHSERGMWVCEPDQGLDRSFVATGRVGGNEAKFGDGQTLYFVRQEPTGIKVWWSEANKPWKIMEEK